jgi:hypothetical protein
MTKKQKTELSALFFDLQRKCEIMREFNQMLAIITKGEREHRRGKVHTYREPVSAAVLYFACKAVLEPIKLPKSWADFSGFRHDYVLGQGLRERAKGLEGLQARWEAMALDYSDHIVGAANGS